MGALCLGLHQFFEFLTLVTNNLLVYKIGLIISICTMYFLLRSLEILTNRKIHSWIALIIIALVSIHIIISPMEFTEKSFYISHDTAFLWAIGYLILFFYWHIGAFKAYSEIKDDKSRKTLIWYLLAVTDISFILSVLYVFIGYIFFSVNVCTDGPSIWCTFSVLQAFFIPYIMYRLDKVFKRSEKKKMFTVKQTIMYLIIALIILAAVVAIFPLFDCLSWKFIFP